jgi:hypothetical protein
MTRFLLRHQHEPGECAAAFAAWRGFASPLRGAEAVASCRYGGHELWLTLDAASAEKALGLLPRFVAERSTATPIHDVEIP